MKIIQKNLLALAVGFTLSASLHADVTPGVGIEINAPATEHVVWQGTPISFAVPVGEERLIHFPGAVQFKNMDPSLTADKVAISNNDGTLYIRALEPFAPIRTYVEVMNSGQIIYLDLSAQAGGNDTAVSVVTPTPSTTTTTSTAHSENPTEPGYIAMLQYAEAELYWPERLLMQLNTNPDYFNFTRSPMHTTHAVHLLMGANVIAMPELSFRNGDLFVTAVLLMNPNKESVHFDPFQDFIGDWQAKAFYPTNYLTPQGTPNDRTTVFLVSDQPFNRALVASVDYR